MDSLEIQHTTGDTTDEIIFFQPPQSFFDSWFAVAKKESEIVSEPKLIAEPLECLSCCPTSLPIDETIEIAPTTLTKHTGKFGRRRKGQTSSKRPKEYTICSTPKRIKTAHSLGVVTLVS